MHYAFEMTGRNESNYILEKQKHQQHHINSATTYFIRIASVLHAPKICPLANLQNIYSYGKRAYLENLFLAVGT